MSHSTTKTRGATPATEEAGAEPTARRTRLGTRRRRTGAKTGGATLRHRLRRDRTLILMTVPALLLLLVFNYVPLIGNVVAFQDYDPYVADNAFQAITQSPWVGLEWFQHMVDDRLFWEALRNTLAIFAIQLTLFFPLPILLALFINSFVRPRVRAVAQAILYLPHFFSWVLVITIFQQMFGGAGLVAQTLRDHGHDGIDLMTDPGLFKFLITFEMIWKDAGWGVIVFLAALAAVNRDLYEASAMDGAGRWRRIWHIALPALRPVVALLLVLQVGNALTVGFEQILLQRQAVGPGASEVLDTYVWNVGIKTGNFSYAAAVGIVKGTFGLLLVLGANKVAHLMGEQGVYKR
ncbi:ABC transporter permease [Streptomyces sp. NBC_01304]|uniref:ABC transporter permease n=1 Tax=Streptomyces sp. NBC_01304 TaxID=2903818 RepID=UPI002E0E501D|nr:ABC transporter permease subunit [Streptomyces sp. NBC_01304]